MSTQNAIVDSHQVIVVPLLKRLTLLNCPKLRALPDYLHRTANLRVVRIEGAHSLHEIVDLPAAVWLKVKHNRNLRRMANLYLLLKRVRFAPKFLVWYVGLVRLCY